MIEFLLHRIKNNILLYLFLLGGCILAVAIFSSIPMYSNGILQQVLSTNMSELGKETSQYPNSMVFEWRDDANTNKDIMETIDNQIEEELSITKQNTIVEEAKLFISSPFRITANEGNFNTNRSRFMNLSELESHTSLVRGEYPSNEEYFEGRRDYLEIMVAEEALVKLDLFYNEIHSLELNKEIFMNVKVVGIIEPMEDDLYWGYELFNKLSYGMVIDDDSLAFVVEANEELDIEEMVLRYYFSYKDIKIDDVATMISQYEVREKWIESNDDMTMEYEFINVFLGYQEEENALRITLWILTIPVLLLTSFYTFMISSLIMKNDGNEIAILKSRGAGTLQIFRLYVIQTVVVGIIAFLVGPFLGKWICDFIGASNGFMQFVNRASLPIEITMEARAYGLLAVGLFTVFTLIPALIASRISIVQFKRNKNENKSKTIWEKAFIDILLLAISTYAYITLNNNDQLGNVSLSIGDSVDPMLFLVSTLFILGINLFILRLFPYVIRFIFMITKKHLNPVMYFSILNVGRADHNLRFIMLFIMLSISFGILGSSQARTLNQNALDKVSYSLGADVVIKPYEIEEDMETYNTYATIKQSYDSPSGIKEVVVDETPYESYKQLDSAKNVTKFLHVEEAAIRYGKKTLEDIEVIGVIPYEYPGVAWFRDDLMHYHLHEYMNILTKAQTAVFVSENLLERQKIKVGDEISMIWDDALISGVVYGFIPSFPTYIPFVEEENDDDEIELVEKSFVLMNYNYIENKMPLQDYDIWLTKEDGVTDQMVQDELVSKQLEANQVEYTTQQIITAKNDPILQGTNGVLTMCFIVTMFITVVGYLIFWMITMKSRALKFGIFRAMGMTMNQVSGIIISEQILMTGSAIGIGFGLGIVASKLFVPLLQYVNTSQVVPPFIVVLDSQDYFRTLGIAGGMLAFGLLVLFVNIRRLKMNQVIKLGED